MANLAPGISHEEISTNNGPIAGADSSVAGFLCTTKWGPIATPTAVESFSEFLRLFGGFETGSDAAYALKGFFENGGQKAWISRMASYSDVTTGALTSAAASTLAVNDTSADKIFDINAKYPGLYGDDIAVILTVNPLVGTTLAANVSNGATSFTVISPLNIVAGQILKLDDGGGTVEFVKVASVVTTVVGGVPTHTVTPTTAIGSIGAPAFTAGDAVTSLEFDIDVYFEDSATAVESWEQLSLESGSERFFEDLINDEDTGSTYIAVDLDATNTRLVAAYGTAPVTATYYPSAVSQSSLSSGGAIGSVDATDLAGDATQGIGIHAFDSIEEIKIVAAIPDSNQGAYDPGFIYEALSFCAARVTTFALTSVDEDESATSAITQRQSDGYNSKYGSMFFNRIKVVDPLTNSTRFISPLGHIAGRIASVDSAANGGPWNAPAGVAPYGNLVGAISVENALNDTQRKNLNNAGINAIASFKTDGVLVYGARTLTLDSTYRYINTTRSLMYIEDSVNEGLRWAVFRNNDTALWSDIKQKLEEFLEGVWADGGLKGNTPADAFTVLVGEDDGVQSASDTLNGRVISEIGVALQRPGEFIIFRWEETLGG